MEQVTSRECARCHSIVARYSQGQPAEGYTYGAPLVACSGCGTRRNADRNASLVIGQRLVARYQKPSKEKPHTRQREEKSSGVVISQEAQSEEEPSTLQARHGDHNEHGTAQGVLSGMERHTSDIAHQLRLPS